MTLGAVPLADSGGAVGPSLFACGHMTAAGSVPLPMSAGKTPLTGEGDTHVQPQGCVTADFKMLALINRLLDWFKSLFWKEEMELTLVGLQYSGKTTFVNVIAVSPQLLLATVLSSANTISTNNGIRAAKVGSCYL